MTEEHPPHPHYGEVEAYRRGEADPAMAAHIDQCAECQAALEELKEIAELLRHEPPVPPMPAHRKEQILWMARKEAARVRRELRLAQMQRWAIAASVVLAVGALLVWRQMGRRAPAQLDAVDGLVLARQVAAAPVADARFDVNGDGKVDRQDVDAVLQRAVSVLVKPALAQPSSAGEVRYTRMDIFIDAGSDALAAYQVEITTTGDAKIVGIGGGDHAAFTEPAFYDPAALHRGGLIILAAISTDADLPRGRTRVADLQMREAGDVSYKIRLMAAARADGSRFKPEVSLVPAGRQE